MKWTEGHQSPNVIDRRGQRSAGLGGGALQLVFLLLRRPWGWAVLLVVGGIWLATGGWRSLVGGERQSAVPGEESAETPMVQFVGFVLDDAQATWQSELEKRGLEYQDAKLVVFTEATESSCGIGDAATGPFYCPRDARVYIDLSFFGQLDRDLGAPGDFAQAYVVAHEIGHHVQNLLGKNAEIQRAPRSEQRGADSQAVRLELQADCYAGIWAHWTGRRELLEPGDIEEGLRAASAIGDDRLQKQSSGRVQPETFTHGSSAQRSAWFKRGFASGAMEECDTFKGPI